MNITARWAKWLYIEDEAEDGTLAQALYFPSGYKLEGEIARYLTYGVAQRWIYN